MRVRRLFVLLLVVVALVLSGSVFLGFELYETELQQRERQDLEQAADQRAATLDARLGELRGTVRLWAETPDVAAHGTSTQRRRLQTFRRESPFEGVSVVAANGTMTNIAAGLDAEARGEVVGGEFGDRTYVQRALDGETYVSEPIVAESGNYIVTISTPIRRDGEVVGTLNAAFHLGDSSLFDSVASDQPTQTVSVVTSDGTVLYGPGVEPSGGTRETSGETAAGTETDTVTNGSVVVGQAQLSETGWVVRVSEPEAAVAARLQSVTYVQIGVILIVLVALGGFGLWVDRQSLGQAAALLAGFERLADGEYGTTIDTGGSAEWEQIRESFDETSERLAATRSQRRERERELRRFRRAIEASAHAIFITDTDATIEYVNPAFERETGYTAEEAVGETPNILYSGQQDDDYYQQFWETIESGEQWESEIVNRRKSGETFHAHQTVAPIADDDGEIEAYVAIQTNVTERKERQRQLEVLDRVLRHNLHNDMNVIRGYAETIRDRVRRVATDRSGGASASTGEAGGETDGETAAAIRDDADRILRKSDQLLSTVDKERDVTRVLSEDVQLSTVDIASVVRHAVSGVSTAFPAATVTTEIPESVEVEATDNVGRAVEELLENAVSHTDQSPPEVEVRVTVGERSVEVTVADNGPGIPAQEREVLTAESGLEPLFHGSGLGLWLVYWVVRRSRGTVEFEENEPRGSVVTIRLSRSGDTSRLLSVGAGRSSRQRSPSHESRTSQ